MDVAFPIETIDFLNQGWLFVYLDQRSVLKTALVFLIDEKKYSNDHFLALEKDMPLLFKNLFIEEDSSTQETTIAFQSSLEDARLRYFNFSKDDVNRTIDWAKIGQYLFFTTSKETALKLIQLLEQ